MKKKKRNKKEQRSLSLPISALYTERVLQMVWIPKRQMFIVTLASASTAQ